MKNYFLPAILILSVLACRENRNQVPERGGVIKTSLSLERDTFLIHSFDSLDQAVWTVEGDDLLIDFNGSVLIGSGDRQFPDEFTGTGLRIKGNRVTVKNLTIRGFKVGLIAEGCDSLVLENCDISYNFRQRLKSIREREDFADWLSYHQNDQDEWLRYGAAVYLKDCGHALVKGLKVTGGQNGLMLSGCNDGLFYNNDISFNSGVGIGLYRSSGNRVMHNRLDWNVRGYSHGIYQRGQDSAGILVYEQSSGNTFAYNSATHSGDGFFLWAGQTTMDTGKGGCNDNLLFKNDFSYAPTNGVEVTFSSNRVIGNKMEECRYGVWGGYSFESVFSNNIISDCDFGIAIEHGQENEVTGNHFHDVKTGVQLWERESQPEDWGYAEERDVRSTGYLIRNNSFSQVTDPVDIRKSTNVTIDSNILFKSGVLIDPADKPVDFNLSHNQTIDAAPESPALRLMDESLLPPIPDGIMPYLPDEQLKGRQYILVDEWGPYDFRSPSIWLRNVEEDVYTFLLLGPSSGNYKITGGEGWSNLNRVSGAFPATLIATKKPDAEWLTLELEYIGETFINRFGHTHKKGKPYRFDFERFEKELDWKVRFYNYDEDADPLEHYEKFRELNKQSPLMEENRRDLYYAWWGSPGKGIQADRFATFSEAEFDIAPGLYKIALTSDDGARLSVDGKILIDHWDIHEPATDEVEVQLGGHHRINVEHFEGGGFGTLDFRISKMDRDPNGEN